MDGTCDHCESMHGHQNTVVTTFHFLKDKVTAVAPNPNLSVAPGLLFPNMFDFCRVSSPMRKVIHPSPFNFSFCAAQDEAKPLNRFGA